MGETKRKFNNSLDTEEYDYETNAPVIIEYLS